LGRWSVTPYIHDDCIAMSVFKIGLNLPKIDLFEIGGYRVLLKHKVG
jgi:hypothetical protein